MLFSASYKLKINNKKKIMETIHNCECKLPEIDRKNIKKGKWLGSSISNMINYSLNDEIFETKEYSLGYDFYAKVDLIKIKCKKCKKTNYIKKTITL